MKGFRERAAPVLSIVLAGVAIPAFCAPARAESGPAHRVVAEIRATLAKEDVAAAVAAADRAVALRPESAAALHWAGRAYGLKAQKASMLTRLSWAGKCRKAWERAVELDPRLVDARMDLISYYLMAPSIAGGGIDKARAQADAIKAIEPVQGHLAAARIASSEKDEKGVEAALRAAVAAGPDRVEGPLALAAWLTDRKRFDEARAVWDPVLARAETRPYAQYQRAKIALADGRQLDEAAAAFAAYAPPADRPDWPRTADALWRLALVEEKRDKKDQAVAALKRALEADPAHARAKAELERLSR